MQTARVTLDYVYDGIYYNPAPGSGFAVPTGVAIADIPPARQAITLSRTYPVTVGAAMDFREVGGAGLSTWTLDAHHVYDPFGNVLYRGDGAQQKPSQQFGRVITTVAGTDAAGFSGDGGPAIQAGLLYPEGVAVAPDGSVLIADDGNRRIRRVGPDGIITTVAGEAWLNSLLDIAVAPDGSILITSGDTGIRRVGPDGIITTFAGTGGPGYSGDGGPAIQAGLCQPFGVVAALDGSTLIADMSNHRIRRVGPDGIISTFAGKSWVGMGGCGSGESGYTSGDGGPATQAGLPYPTGVAVAPDGSVLISSENRIRRVGPDGIITTFAGTGTHGYSGDGGLATQARLSFPTGVAVAPDGSVLISSENRIRRVGPDGIITTFAGTGTNGYSGDGGLATQARLSFPTGVAVAADGSVLIADRNNSRIRKVAPNNLPGFVGNADFAIASSDGRHLYAFDANGRHLRTVDTLTQAVVYTFAYDSAGRLTTVTDGDGNILRIERDPSGHPTALVAPFGQRTLLSVDDNGYLARVANPAGEAYAMAYTPDGLLTAFTDPKGQAAHFTYNALGRLQRDANAAGGSQTLSRTE
ncbi:MAG: hypothetical protein JNK95_01665, partial [Candidatus Competibacter sp.]|nr:hypothetical protein [Candidatus Competibacter sp.]